MKRATYPLAIGVAVLGLTGSCTTHGGNSFLTLERVVYATGTLDTTTTPPSVKDCKFDATAGEALFPTFKADGTQTLSLGLVVDNRLSSAAPDLNHVNMHDFTATKATVNFEGAGGTGTLPAEQTLNAQGHVVAGGAGAVLADLIPKEVAAGLGTFTAVRVHVFLTGFLGDGSTVKTTDYEFIAKPGPGGNCFAQ